MIGTGTFPLLLWGPLQPEHLFQGLSPPSPAPGVLAAQDRGPEPVGCVHRGTHWEGSLVLSLRFRISWAPNEAPGVLVCKLSMKKQGDSRRCSWRGGRLLLVLN